MNRYFLTPEAQDDLRGIRAYLVAEGGPRVARYVIGGFVNAFRSLAKMPGQGHRPRGPYERQNAAVLARFFLPHRLPA